MSQISHHHLRQLSEALLEIHGAVSFAELPHVWLRVLRRLIAADVYTADAFDLVEMRGVFTVWPEQPSADPAILIAQLHEHPTLSVISNPLFEGAVRWSDFTTLRQFRDTGLYHDFFRGQGIRHQLAISFPTGQTSGALALNRKRRDFSEEERAVLEFLRPHIEQSWVRVQERTELEEALSWSSIAAKGQAVLALAEDGTVLYVSKAALRMGRDLFGEAPQSWAPRLLRQWRAERRSPDYVLTQVCKGQHLSVRIVGPAALPASAGVLGITSTARRGYVLRLSERSVVQAPQLAQRLGLTPREAEVLLWMAQGKRNAEIATILGARPRTVDKHVENLMTKLGVETRGAASAMAWEG